MFNSKFLKEFLCQKRFIFIWFKVLEKSKKNRVFGNWFLIFILISILWFSQVFFFIIFIPNSLFSHTWAIISILSIESYFCGIYVILWDFIEGKKNQVLIPIIVWPGLLPVDRSGRPMCTNVHSHFGWWASRPTGRPTVGNPAELDPNGYIF